MKHDWYDPRPNGPERMFSEKRKCHNCGAEQNLKIETSWMRIVGRRWMPLVGRCKKERVMNPAIHGWYFCGRDAEGRSRGWELFRNGALLGRIRPYRYGRGWTVRVEGVPHLRPNVVLSHGETRVNYRGMAASKKRAEAIIVAAYDEHKECSAHEYRCKHGVKMVQS